jgi:hypothetical protein
MERFPLRNSAVFLALSCIGKWGKTPHYCVWPNLPKSHNTFKFL